MPLAKIGLNLTGLQNVTQPTFDLKNTSTELINDIPVKANEITGGWWGLIALSTLFTFLMYKFHKDRADGGEYGYSTARGIGIASSICSIIGLYAINLGYFTNFWHVTIFITIAFITTGAVYRGAS